MKPNITTKFMQLSDKKYYRIIPHLLFASMLMVSLFAGSSTSVKAVSSYTDEWMDDSEAQTVYDEGDGIATPYIIGSGVTRTEYYEDYHLVGVQTTITSPNGRSNTVYGYGDHNYYKQPWIARAESPLVWQENDLGTYAVSSIHFSLCPSEEFGSTSSGLPIGASFSCYLKQWAVSDGTKVTALYRVIENCNCSCKSDTATIIFRRGPAYVPKPFLVVVEPYAYTPIYGKICSHITTWRDVTECHTCIDIDSIIP